jgi:chromosome segregation ATPase
MSRVVIAIQHEASGVITTNLWTENADEHVERLNGELNQHRAAHRNAMQLVDQARETVAASETTIADLREEVSRKDARLQTQRETFEAKWEDIRDLTRDLTVAQDQVENLTRTLRELKSESKTAARKTPAKKRR